MQKLTSKFNQATVKKGETFAIDLPTGGFIGRYWQDPQVTVGKATLVDAPETQDTGCTGAMSATWTFKAEKAGSIEITAKSSMNETQIFKLRVI